MVHTLPGAQGAAGSAPSGAGDGGAGPLGDRERLSGLRISDRQIRPSRWDDLMRGRSYVPFDRLSSIESLEAGSKDAVMIGVVYEKSLMKTSSNGNEFVHWTFTDLAFPQPNLMTLFLYGQAFETWEKHAETPLATGSILAILNPVPLASRSSGGREDRRAAKVNNGTQLVCLGTCPSLGHCQCNKKDGLKCSMPCDRDKGPLVCYYHTMSQAAQQAKQWKNKNSAGTGSSKAPAARGGADGIFVLQPPARPAPPPQSGGLRGGGGAQPPLVRGGGAQPSATPPHASRPAGAQAQGASLSSTRGGKSGGGGLDAAVQRLLSGTPKAPAPAPRGPGASAAPAGEAGKGRPPASPARVAAEARPHSAPAAALPKRSGVAEEAAARAAGAESAAARRLQVRFPEGIPEPDPNNPLANVRQPPSRDASARTAHAATKPAWPPTAAPPQLRRGLGQRPQPQAAPFGGGAAPPIVLSSSGSLAAGGGADIPGLSSGSSKQGAKSASVAKRRTEKEFGKKVAMQLDVADPRKDLVRRQQSRFQAVVEQEKVAKRHRDLAELEAQDAMAEKMEAITSIAVQAWKCKECASTTESQRAKIFCEELGHSVTMVTAQKTRWECKSCSFDVSVLDRELPKQCNRCKSDVWRPVPLRRMAKKKMERDLLLPRGDELPSLNSIPTGRSFTRFKEAKDDYAGLETSFGT